MADYELYGDYNRGEDEEDEGPKKNPVLVIIALILKWIFFCILIGTCVFFAIRITISNIYPKDMKQLLYTSDLITYAESNALNFEYQELRVPFECDVILNDTNEAISSDSQNGFFYANYLIVERSAGFLQITIRMNKNNYSDVEEKYSLSDVHLDNTHFTYTLVSSNGSTYSAKATLEGHMAYYDYIKLAFDGIAFDDVTWIRLEIKPTGMSSEVEAEYVDQAICIYENNDTFNTFKKYKLKRSEKLS